MHLCTVAAQAAIRPPEFATKAHVDALEHVDLTGPAAAEMMIAVKAPEPRQAPDDRVGANARLRGPLDEVAAANAADPGLVPAEQPLQPVRVGSGVVVRVRNHILRADGDSRLDRRNGPRLCDRHPLERQDFRLQSRHNLLRGDVALAHDHHDPIRRERLHGKRTQAPLERLRATVRGHDHRDRRVSHWTAS
jgi:hypothetical protein